MATMAVSRKTTKPKPKAFVLAPQDGDILRALLRYQYLSIKQVKRLFYSAGSYTVAATRLKTLKDHGYIEPVPLPTRVGNGPFLYYLTRKGMTTLAHEGLVIPKRAKSKSDKKPGVYHLLHKMAVCDVLIATELIARSHPSVITLQQLLAEHTLQQRPVLVDNGKGGKTAVIPDGFVDLLLSSSRGVERMSLALEIDRGTEDQPTWRGKVKSLVAFAQGPYQQAYGSDALTICVVTTTGHARLQQLYSWTADELTALGQQAEADLFRFATCDTATIAPDQLYFGTGWAVPLHATPVSLLDPRLIQQPRPTNGVAQHYR